MNKKSLAIVVNNYSENMETFILNHIKEVYKSNYFDITVICSYWDKKVIIGNGINVIVFNNALLNRIKSSCMYFFGQPLASFRLMKFGRVSKNLSVFEAALKLKNTNFDIIHCHFGHNGNVFAPLVAKRMLKPQKFITQFHGLDLTSKLVKRKDFYKFLIGTVDIALGNTHFSGRKLRELGFSDEKIVLIPVGTDTFFFKKETSTVDDVFTILFIGRLIELKGIKLIPEIDQKLKHLIKDKYSIKIIGNGPLYNFLEQYQNGSPQNNIELLGYKTALEIKEILSNTNVLIYPGYKDTEGREESQGTIIQEAMSMSLPVIVTNVGGVAEGVYEGVNGFVIQQKDTSTFVEKIEFLYKNPNIAIGMGEDGRNFVVNKYDSKHIITEILNLYEMV